MLWNKSIFNNITLKPHYVIQSIENYRAVNKTV